ncbi:MAG: hypothetical protein GX564_05130 [Oligosphaeraceae bacterium]|nr:hypothetical protein [Oligosphaeraceae bacterium]
MRVTRLFLSVCLLSCLLNAAECEYLLDIPLQQPSLAALEIPAEVLLSLGGRPEALRIMDGQNRTVPWLREQLHTSRTEFGLNSCPSQPQLVKEGADGSLEMHFLLQDKAPQPTGLSIQTSLQNFEQQVQISGWDGQQWHILLQDGLIFESSRTLSLKNTDLEFDSGKFRQFKVLVSRASLERQSPLRSVQRSWDEAGQSSASEKLQVQAQPFKIDAVRFWQRFSYDSAAGPCWLYPESAEMHLEAQPKKNQTVITIQPQCYPVYGLKVQCQEKNFSRQARVCQLTANGEIPLAQERIWTLDLPGLKKDSLEIRFPPIQDGKLQISLQDGDNPALHYQGISTITPAWGLYFFVAADGLPYRLTAAPGEKEPQYDNAQIIRQARLQTTPVKALLLARQGMPLPLGNAAPPASGHPRRWLLLVVLLSTAALAYGIIKAVRKTAVGD